MNKIQDVIIHVDSLLRNTADAEEKKQLEVTLQVLIDLRDNYKHHVKVIPFHVNNKARQTTPDYL